VNERVANLTDRFAKSERNSLMRKEVKMRLATPAGFEPATFSLAGRQEALSDQRKLRLFPSVKQAFCGES
jgi:hypothetical protein